MAVSEIRYAAEIVDRDEKVFKFDDIGCMRRFLKAHRPQGAALYVRDYDGGGWLNAADAHYVRSDAIPSPMGGHIIGLKQKPAAEKYAKRFQGVVLDWRNL
jgi:copper chaperone NosL